MFSKENKFWEINTSKNKLMEVGTDDLFLKVESSLRECICTLTKKTVENKCTYKQKLQDNGLLYSHAATGIYSESGGQKQTHNPQ